jgi:hypothetical protein
VGSAEWNEGITRKSTHASHLTSLPDSILQMGAINLYSKRPGFSFCFELVGSWFRFRSHGVRRLPACLLRLEERKEEKHKSGKDATVTIMRRGGNWDQRTQV